MTRHAPRSLRSRLAVAALLLATAAGGAVAEPADPIGAPGADDFAAARRLLEHNEDEAARARLLVAAEAGHPGAAAALGTLALYEPGWSGDEPRERFARRWLSIAARSGDAGARSLLSTMDTRPTEVVGTAFGR